jgi:hypothetical protein
MHQHQQCHPHQQFQTCNITQYDPYRQQ